jgi:FtsZ-binding cell division protein ZapB
LDPEMAEIDILEKRIEGAVQFIDGLKKREDELKTKLHILEDENRRLKAESENLARAKEEARGKVEALIGKLKLIEE